MIADRGTRKTRPATTSDDSIDIDDPRVVAAAQEYLAAIEAGRPLDQQQFLRSPPRHCRRTWPNAWRGSNWSHAAAKRHAASPTAAAASPQARDKFRCRLGDFRLLREIGRGGMGIVYEAIQLSLGRRVAVKILPFATSLDPKHLQRFKNESQAAAQLHHTNIVPVYAVGSQRGVHFYAMQLIDGEPLSAMIDHLRRLAGKPATTELHSAPCQRSGDRTGGRPLAAASRATRWTTCGPASARPCRDRCTRPTRRRRPPRHRGSAASSTVLAASHGRRPVYFRTIARLDAANGRGARARPRAGHHPSRHQAGQPDSRSRAAISGSPISAWPNSRPMPT